MVARWGAPVVTLSFLTVGIQTLVNLAAGVMRMPLRRYIPALTVGAILWAFCTRRWDSRRSLLAAGV